VLGGTEYKWGQLDPKKEKLGITVFEESWRTVRKTIENKYQMIVVTGREWAV